MSRGATFVRFYPSDWRSGCIGLSFEQEGLYVRICAYIYETRKRIPASDSAAARILGANTNAYTKVRKQLCDLGLLTMRDGEWTVSRAEVELAKVDAARSEGEVERRVAPRPERQARKDAVDVTQHDTPTDTTPVQAEKTQSFLRATKEPITNNQENSVYVSGASANPNSDNQKPNSDMPEGFAPLGHGALINCETIRHPEFVISIPAVKMALALSNLQVDARNACSAAALQWAAALEGGQKKRDVVPGNITGAIVGGVRMGRFRELEHETRTARAAAGKPQGTARLDYAEAKTERNKAFLDRLRNRKSAEANQ